MGLGSNNMFNKLLLVTLRLCKTLLILLLMFIVITAIITTIIVKMSGDSDFKYRSPGFIVNDVTQLNPVRVAKVITPTTSTEISHQIKITSGPISIGGGRYSQGGQIAFPDSLHIDMRQFDKVLSLDDKNKLITVEAGITWRKIQEFIDPYDLSVKIMQTYSNFTVGGSLSVNVHGRYVGEGPLVHSVRSLKVVLADSTIITASPSENKEVFYGIIGGYGGLGVIIEATLDLAENVKIERRTKTMATDKYKDYFFENIRDNKEIVFSNADLYPPDYTDARDVSWFKTDKDLTNTERLRPTDSEYDWLPGVAEFVADYDIGKSVRKNIFDPWVYWSDAVVWRNWEASYDVVELEPDSREETTYALREYFVPVEEFDNFLAIMRDVFLKHDANILNVSIRHAKADPDTLLSWAEQEVFAFVVYYRQGTSLEERESVAKWSTEIIDAVISVNGTYYLPYQNHASVAQFNQAYSNAGQYFELKKKFDPTNRFTNSLWKKYYLDRDVISNKSKSSVGQYFRGEEQTFLTIPEWYLVFNPKEYADYLEVGNNPSDFPFLASIDEYWKLYDRVLEIAKEDYPENSEYLTMLKVIGISTTIEYMYKGLYENTVGRFTYWISDGETKEDIIIQQAHRAYSQLIFDKAWYEFDFEYWSDKVWHDTDFFGNNFIRKLERKLFFTLEFGFKQVYANLIGRATKSTYEVSDELIYLTATNTDKIPHDLPSSVKLLNQLGEVKLLSLPRWGGVTNTIPQLVDVGFSFIDISGNKRISVSILHRNGNKEDLKYGELLFSSSIVSDVSSERLVYLVKVSDLGFFIKEIRKSGIELEHIYDY